MTIHFYEPSAGHGLAHDPLLAIVGPRPIGWVSTCSATGIPNLAPYSFFNIFSSRPPLIGFASNGPKDSVTNVEATKEFVWNLATRPLADKMNLSSADLAADADEFSHSELTPVPATLVNCPRVAESPVSLECRVAQVIRLQNALGEETPARLVIGEVIGVHIADALLRDGVYDTVAARPILRGGGSGDYFEIMLEGHFHMARPRQ